MYGVHGPPAPTRYSVDTAPEPSPSVRVNATRAAPAYAASGAPPLMRAAVTGGVWSTLTLTDRAGSALPSASVDRYSTVWSPGASTAIGAV